MGLFSKKPMGGGILDVIRCDESSYLIWKWHPQNTTEQNNRKENAIRWGSSLRVKEGSVAVFVYKQKDGTLQDYIEGPFDGILKTKNLPVISDILGLAYEGESPFPAEIYFINLAQINQIKFAVPYFDVYDPRFLDYSVPTAVRGTISYKITDYVEFIKLHRLETFSVNDFQNQIKDALSKYIKNIVANAPEENGIPAIQLERKIKDINEIAEIQIKSRFFKEFGVTVNSLDIAVIDIDKSSEGYQQLKAVTMDLSTKTLQAKAEVDIKEIRDAQKLSVLERAQNIKEDAYARHKQSQSANLTAYQIEAQEHVGVASARGFGMINSGGNTISGNGMNPATIMAGMAVGGAIGQNMAGTINSIMHGAPQSYTAQQVPPPIPITTLYNIAVNGQPVGPFDIVALSKMVMSGELLPETLVWTKGMTTWDKAENVTELKPLFAKTTVPVDSNEMPPIPQNIK